MSSQCHFRIRNALLPQLVDIKHKFITAKGIELLSGSFSSLLCHWSACKQVKVAWGCPVLLLDCEYWNITLHHLTKEEVTALVQVISLPSTRNKSNQKRCSCFHYICISVCLDHKWSLSKLIPCCSLGNHSNWPRVSWPFSCETKNAFLWISRTCVRNDCICTQDAAPKCCPSYWCTSLATHGGASVMRYGNNPSKRPRHACSRSPSWSFQHGAVALWEVFLLQTIFSHIIHSITFSFEMPNVWFAGRFAAFLSQKGNRTRKITFKGEVLAFSCSPSFSLMIPKYTVHLKQTPMYSLSDAANRTAPAVLWTFCAPT